MNTLKAAGIELLQLDVQSSGSIANRVTQVRDLTGDGGNLDILLNNAGMTYYTSLTNTSIPQAKSLFDLNVRAPLAMIQAFMPLLLNSQSKSASSPPNHRPHHDSKPHLNRRPNPDPLHVPLRRLKAVPLRHDCCSPRRNDTLQHQSAGLRAGCVASNIHAAQASNFPLPENSWYRPARVWMARLLDGRSVEGGECDADRWAERVVKVVKEVYEE